MPTMRTESECDMTNNKRTYGFEAWLDWVLQHSWVLQWSIVFGNLDNCHDNEEEKDAFKYTLIFGSNAMNTFLACIQGNKLYREKIWMNFTTLHCIVTFVQFILPGLSALQCNANTNTDTNTNTSPNLAFVQNPTYQYCNARGRLNTSCIFYPKSSPLPLHIQMQMQSNDSIFLSVFSF